MSLKPRVSIRVLYVLLILSFTAEGVSAAAIRGRIRGVPVKGMVTVMVYPEEYAPTIVEVPEEDPILMFEGEPAAFEAVCVWGDAFISANTDEGLPYEVVNVPSGRYVVWAGEFFDGMLCPWAYGAYNEPRWNKSDYARNLWTRDCLSPITVDVLGDVEGIDIYLDGRLLPGKDTMQHIYTSYPFWYGPINIGLPPGPDPPTSVILGKVVGEAREGVILVEKWTPRQEQGIWVRGRVTEIYLSRPGRFMFYNGGYIRVSVVDRVEKPSIRIESPGIGKWRKGEPDSSWTRITFPPLGLHGGGIPPRTQKIVFELSGEKGELVSSEFREYPEVKVSPGEMLVTLPGGVPMVMVYIQPGTFMMGGSDIHRPLEGPQHEVTISRGSYLGKYEVTREQWEAVMETRPWEGPDFWLSGGALIEDTGIWYGPYPTLPAMFISWNDAQAFIAKLNTTEGDSVYRLPTEAEWEYSCRAGTTTEWYWGDDPGQARYLAKLAVLIDKWAHPVGFKSYPNPWGLYDMSGNVWEWTQDWFGPYPSEPQIDPIGPATGSKRVRRGGSWVDWERTRSAARGAESPDYRAIDVGFRVLRMTSDTPTSITPESWGQIKRQYWGK